MIKTLQEYLQEKMPSIDLAAAKEIIKHYNDYHHEYRPQFCDICGKKLTINERLMNDNELYPTAFNYCCLEHKAYAHHYQREKVRRLLNIPEPDLFTIIP